MCPQKCVHLDWSSCKIATFVLRLFSRRFFKMLVWLNLHYHHLPKSSPGLVNTWRQVSVNESITRIVQMLKLNSVFQKAHKQPIKARTRTAACRNIWIVFGNSINFTNSDQFVSQPQVCRWNHLVMSLHCLLLSTILFSSPSVWVPTCWHSGVMYQSEPQYSDILEPRTSLSHNILESWTSLSHNIIEPWTNVSHNILTSWSHAWVWASTFLHPGAM